MVVEAHVQAQRPARPGRRAAARVLLLLVVLPYLGVLVSAVPGYWSRLTTICTEACIPWQPGPVTQDALDALGIPIEVYGGAVLAVHLGGSVAHLAVAAVLAVRRPRGWYPALVVAVLIVSGSLGPAYVYAEVLGIDGGPVQLLVGLTTLWLWPAVAVFLVCFPDGRLAPRWSLLVPVAFWLRVWLYVWEHPAAPTAIALTGLLCYGSAFLVQVHRYRHLYDRRARQQTKWFVYILTVSYGVQQLYLGLPVLLPPVATAPGYVLLEAVVPVLSFLSWPAAVGVAVVGHRLWDIDVVVRRTVVYTVLTAAVSAIYLVVVASATALLRPAADPLSSIVAVLVAAAAFQPLRTRLHDGVERALYGERRDPFRILTALGDRVAGVPDPAVLDATITTIASALRLPYGAIELRGDDADGGAVLAQHGVRPVDGRPMVELDLVHRDHHLGRLVLSPRDGEVGLSAVDRRVLEDVARHAATIIRSLRLAEQLRTARHALVTATEEERRRLRRDLHDGLGSQLASMSLTVAAARARLAADPATADALLNGLGVHLHEAVEDVRRLVYQLRPPALDELGLVAALRLRVDRYHDAGVVITVHSSPEPLPPLGAAVEAAAYRIVEEALTNVLRHARARRCHVSITAVEHLVVEVRDDGTGMAADAGSGVGLLSMAERAAELGGRVEWSAAEPHGTVVTAELPLVVGTR